MEGNRRQYSEEFKKDAGRAQSNIRKDSGRSSPGPFGLPIVI
jgi:hypothetical protein